MLEQLIHVNQTWMNEDGTEVVIVAYNGLQVITNNIKGIRYTALECPDFRKSYSLITHANGTPVESEYEELPVHISKSDLIRAGSWSLTYWPCRHNFIGFKYESGPLSSIMPKYRDSDGHLSANMRDDDCTVVWPTHVRIKKGSE